MDTNKKSERTKYPRTFHVAWSLGATDDDKTLTMEETESMFKGKQVVVTEKLDGENTSIYSDGTCHARSLDSGHHASRSVVKALAAEVGSKLPEGWRLLGENLYAKHSIEYTELSGYFVLFGVANKDNFAVSWYYVAKWAEELNIPLAPVIYQGIWDAKKIKALYPFNSKVGGSVAEGYVVRTEDAFWMKDFNKNVAKFVRANHVTTDKHWSQGTVVPNKLKR